MYEKKSNYALSTRAEIIVRSTEVPKSPQYPAGVDFAVIGRIRFGHKYAEVIRVDNSKHQGKGGTHIHFMSFEQERVEYAPDLQDPSKAQDYVEAYLKRRYVWLMDGDYDARGN